MSPRRSPRSSSRRPSEKSKKRVIKGQRKVERRARTEGKHWAKQRGIEIKKSLKKRVPGTTEISTSCHSKKYGGKTNGMWNLGNTCWLNSIVHCFRAVPGFEKYLNQILKDKEISSLEPEKLKTAIALMETIESLALKLRRSPRLNLPPSCIPFKLWTALKKPRRQHDTHEWLMWFLNCIAQVESSSMLQKEVRLTDFFLGSQISILSCNGESCRFEKRNIEPFQILSLGLKKVVHGTGRVMQLSNMLRDYLSIENIGKCLECNGAGVLTKRLVLDRLPLNLMFHLKRFEFDRKTCTIGKIKQKVEFPLNDLSILSKPLTRYDLLAVVNHKGTIDSGHYTALVREKGRWYLFDDESVTSVAKRDVVSKYAYMLLYRQQD